MKATAKLRFLIGILVVILLVGGLTVYLNYSMAISHSVKAALDAQGRAVGTDYSGLVVKQNIEEGQEISKDDVLFEIDSLELKQGLANNTISAAGLAINPDTKNLQLRATNSGVVDEIFFREGAYVSKGAVIASIFIVDSLFVNAHFQLSPPDYARIERDKKLTLLFPDNTTKTAEITTINLESSEDKENVDTVITAKVLDTDMSDFRFSVGTPVDATLYLENDAWYQNLLDFFTGLFVPKEN